MRKTINERVFTGQIISWINELVNADKTKFEWATNDEGISIESGPTVFPDILLFSDKIAALVFNGWELKFPNTEVDDEELLENALKKAKALRTNSFVTWNGRDAIIWLIKGEYIKENLEILKKYPSIYTITNIGELKEYNKFLKHEEELKERLFEILKDLEAFKENGILRESNFSDFFTITIQEATSRLIPLYIELLENYRRKNNEFNNAFRKWYIIEGVSLLRDVTPSEVLARHIVYKLIGQIIFCFSLSQFAGKKIPILKIKNKKYTQKELSDYFRIAERIDYQAIFKKDFTDKIIYSYKINTNLYQLINYLSRFDFTKLPLRVVGEILEHLVPKEEKRRLGQYFTNPILANLITSLSIRARDKLVFDPVCGVGTFIIKAYELLKHYGIKTHEEIINQIWGNDISHFPAELATINLYRQDIKNTNNFPRVIRENYFNLYPGYKIELPDAKTGKKVSLKLPTFDAIVTNFPFIQQEGIDKVEYEKKFRKEFGKNQQALLQNGEFNIDKHSDFYVYCLYNTLKFINIGGRIGAITSNSWLNKNFGVQLKKFMLDNFKIKYIFRSIAEPWFLVSKVNTIFVILEREANATERNKNIVKFITLNKMLNELFPDEQNRIKDIEYFISEIDYYKESKLWEKYIEQEDLFLKKDNSAIMCAINQKILSDLTINKDLNWGQFFMGADLLKNFESKLVPLCPNICEVSRGVRTGWDSMFYLTEKEINKYMVEREYLVPIIKNSRDVKNIFYKPESKHFVFICSESLEILKKRKKMGALSWIKKFKDQYTYMTDNSTRKKKKLLVKDKLFNIDGHRPFWYSLPQEAKAPIFISLNPYKRIYFGMSEKEIFLNQRLTAIKPYVKFKSLLVCALLNSIVSLLYVEINGTSRALGALDTNSTFFRDKMKILNPELLSKNQKQKIIAKFIIVANRPIGEIDSELDRKDRMYFDAEVLKAYGYEPNEHLPYLYSALRELVRIRVSLKKGYADLK